MGTYRVCPKCESYDVVRRPENGITPHPGYECEGCGLVMRPNGTAWMFVVLMLVCLGVLALSLTTWIDPKPGDRVSLVLPVAAGGGALTCLYQLFRPTPRLMDDMND